jgi:hypothetical protein
MADPGPQDKDIADLLSEGKVVALLYSRVYNPHNIINVLSRYSKIASIEPYYIVESMSKFLLYGPGMFDPNNERVIQFNSDKLDTITNSDVTLIFETPSLLRKRTIKSLLRDKPQKIIVLINEDSELSDYTNLESNYDVIYVNIRTSLDDFSHDFKVMMPEMTERQMEEYVIRVQQENEIELMESGQQTKQETLFLHFQLLTILDIC